MSVFQTKYLAPIVGILVTAVIVSGTFVVYLHNKVHYTPVSEKIMIDTSFSPAVTTIPVHYKKGQSDHLYFDDRAHKMLSFGLAGNVSFEDEPIVWIDNDVKIVNKTTSGKSYLKIDSKTTGEHNGNQLVLYGGTVTVYKHKG